MKKEDFIGAIYDAGWRPQLDAQYTEISKVWAILFPVVAALESELEDFHSEIRALLIERLEKIATQSESE